MTNPDPTDRVRAIIEDELGEFRPFVHLTARDIETMADRLTRALAPVLAPMIDGEPQAAEQRSAA